MYINIVGGGAIGMFLASQLAERYSIRLYVRTNEQKEALKRNGLHYYKQDVCIQKQYINVQVIDNYEPGDFTFICVKQQDIKGVLLQIGHQMKQETCIFLQNGMGHLKYIEDLPTVYVGVVEYGVTKKNAYTVNHLGDGKIVLAALHGKVNIDTLLKNNLLTITTDPSWQRILHNKLIVNAVINPITALFTCKNGAILKNDHLLFIAKRICEETAEVLEMDANKAWEKIIEILESTKYNRSSMLADRQAAKKTEIEAITGYVIEKAKTSIPYTTFIYHAILALERGDTCARTHNRLD